MNEEYLTIEEADKKIREALEALPQNAEPDPLRGIK
jgi:hypothetical protein